MDEETVNKKGNFIKALFKNITEIYTEYPKLTIVATIVLVVGGFFYWVSNLPDVEEPTKTEEVTSEPKDDKPVYEITEKTFFIDKGGYRKGDTVYVDYYSDGYIEKYYTDNETYKED